MDKARMRISSRRSIGSLARSARSAAGGSPTCPLARRAAPTRSRMRCSAPLATVVAPYINCGFGQIQDIPSDASGKICVIERGVVPPGEKARNAKEAGAVAVIIYNNDDRRNDIALLGLVTDGEYDFPLTIAMTFANAQKLLNGDRGAATESYRYRVYGSMTGTSDRKSTRLN